MKLSQISEIQYKQPTTYQNRTQFGGSLSQSSINDLYHSKKNRRNQKRRLKRGRKNG